MADETGAGFAGGTSGFSSTDDGFGTLQRGDEPRAAGHELKERAREGGRDLLDQAVAKKDELKARAGTVVDDGRHRAADRAGTLARALHGTAENLAQDGDQQLSRWVHQAADQVDRVVGYLNGHDAGGLMRDMEDLARRNPALFLGGTYAAGLVLGRFLRASAPERRHERELRSDQGSEGLRAGGEEWVSGTPSFHESGRSGLAESAPGSGGTAASRDSLAGGHTTGGRTDESLRHGQDLGGTPGYGASFAGVGAGLDDMSASEPMSSRPPSEGAGLTDEDLRAAWHERAAGRTDDGMHAGGRDGERLGDRLGSGELTRYPNGDSEREV